MSSQDSSSFLPLNIALLTISDTRSTETDRSGTLLEQLITESGHNVVTKQIVKDEQNDIITQMKRWIKDPSIDVIISTGGTGVSARDVTPEAVRTLYDKEIEGFGEIFRMLSYNTIGPSTIQSRATAGVSAGTYIFALPGSPGACRDAWTGILKHQLDSRQRPCNLVTLMPRR